MASPIPSDEPVMRAHAGFPDVDSRYFRIVDLRSPYFQMNDAVLSPITAQVMYPIHVKIVLLDIAAALEDCVQTAATVSNLGTRVRQ